MADQIEVEARARLRELITDGEFGEAGAVLEDMHPSFQAALGGVIRDLACAHGLNDRHVAEYGSEYEGFAADVDCLMGEFDVIAEAEARSRDFTGHAAGDMGHIYDLLCETDPAAAEFALTGNGVA